MGPSPSPDAVKNFDLEPSPTTCARHRSSSGRQKNCGPSSGSMSRLVPVDERTSPLGICALLRPGHSAGPVADVHWTAPFRHCPTSTTCYLSRESTGTTGSSGSIYLGAPRDHRHNSKRMLQESVDRCSTTAPRPAGQPASRATRPAEVAVHLLKGNRPCFRQKPWLASGRYSPFGDHRRPAADAAPVRPAKGWRTRLFKPSS